ncbi:hypothetical protein [Rhodomicrobium udaipurense]|uniref:Uncharacterized protein n=1 Tax=Rhodomicrobium udaipurense TaxID=1202716 RepID=A0A8I1GGN8_9HYPH|nr:hypothetical protein [Rhodomicrobium udaipurense]MBJ7544433.1 hypothetical protein [Rhodomicrobium udaipurense]
MKLTKTCRSQLSRINLQKELLTQKNGHTIAGSSLCFDCAIGVARFGGGNETVHFFEKRLAFLSENPKIF